MPKHLTDAQQLVENAARRDVRAKLEKRVVHLIVRESEELVAQSAQPKGNGRRTLRRFLVTPFLMEGNRPDYLTWQLAAVLGYDVVSGWPGECLVVECRTERIGDVIESSIHRELYPNEPRYPHIIWVIVL